MVRMDEVKIVAQCLHEETKNANDEGTIPGQHMVEGLLTFATSLGERWWEYDSHFDRDKFMEWVFNGVPGGFPS